MRLGDNIRRLRLKQNMSRDVLARLTGIPKNTLRSIELADVRMPSYDKVVFIADVLGTTPEKLCPLPKKAKPTFKTVAVG